MLKPYLIRKMLCGHWHIFKIVYHYTGIFTVTNIAKLENFGDVLMFMNAGAKVNG